MRMIRSTGMERRAAWGYAGGRAVWGGRDARLLNRLLQRSHSPVSANPATDLYHKDHLLIRASCLRTPYSLWTVREKKMDQHNPRNLHTGAAHDAFTNRRWRQKAETMLLQVLYQNYWSKLPLFTKSGFKAEGCWLSTVISTSQADLHFAVTILKSILWAPAYLFENSYY